jgi:OOP family OmpA-OmpF porin
MSRRKVNGNMATELTSYRGRLVTALGNGSQQRMPRDAAHALAMFDCWAENAEEDRIKDKPEIAKCRSEFMTALSRIEVASTPPPPSPIVENYTILFAHDSAALGEDAKRSLTRIVDRARAIGAKTVAVAGYTDRSGADGYNMTLSQKREVAVTSAMKAAGVAASIEGKAFGETQPATPTADGVREEKNRRVTVIISQ